MVKSAGDFLSLLFILRETFKERHCSRLVQSEIYNHQTVIIEHVSDSVYSILYVRKDTTFGMVLQHIFLKKLYRFSLHIPQTEQLSLDQTVPWRKHCYLLKLPFITYLMQ